MMDNPLLKKPSYLAVWMFFLLNVAHTPKAISVMFKGKQIYLEAGQLTCGSFQVSQAIDVPRSTIARIVKAFETAHMIRREASSECSLITIVNWGKYQRNETHSEMPVSNDRTLIKNESNVNKPREKLETVEAGEGMKKYVDKTLLNWFTRDMHVLEPKYWAEQNIKKYGYSIINKVINTDRPESIASFKAACERRLLKKQSTNG